MVGGGGCRGTWDSRSQEILSSLTTLTDEAERSLAWPKQRSHHCTLVVIIVVVGPFEEEVFRRGGDWYSQRRFVQPAKLGEDLETETGLNIFFFRSFETMVQMN